VVSFKEKPQGRRRLINGGFFVLSPEGARPIEGDDTTVWEQEPLERLASGGTARRLPSTRLLAADGHAARQEPARRAVGKRQGALEGVAVTRRVLAGRVSSDGPHRLQGQLAEPVAAVAGRARSPGYALPRRPSRACSTLARVGRRHAVDGSATSATSALRNAMVARGAARSRDPHGGAAAGAPLLREPVETYATNVMGTVHVLEAVRQRPGVRAVVNVTTDKCYENREWVWGYRENEPMGGYDPYSNSKGCAELVTNAYRNSFFLAGQPRWRWRPRAPAT
jgi:hypothetical protein